MTPGVTVEEARTDSRRHLWDAHAHVIGGGRRFPLVPDRAYTPAAASLEDYLAMLDRQGIARGVLVQPSVYGFDNSCLLDALDRAGRRLAGIVVPPPRATARDLEAMHRRGARGVRLNLLNPGTLPVEAVTTWQPVLRALGWHVELHVAVEETDVAKLIDRFDVPLVIDHMGRPASGRTDPALPHLSRLVGLVRDGACYVKLSAPYRLSDAPPPWADVVPLARALVAANPRRCLWGTDWPHVHTAARVHVDDLVAARDSWCPDAEVRRIVMSEAAGDLY
jgi:predicted TIM-barrel fold metal-dependent hydrolase